MGDHVTIFEMGPRDGLQNEVNFVPTADKIELINLLTACGFEKIEATSFVSPKWVPQLADATEVMSGIDRRAETTYAVLTPNLRGFDAAMTASADEVAVFASASEGFSQKNINCSVSESLDRFAPVLEAAKARHVPVRGYVSCITDCPYDGEVSPSQVVSVVEKLLAMGCYEISLGDTLGSATPEGVERLLADILERTLPDQLAGHFHDTSGRALHNIEVCLDHGIRVFDASIAGLGGCPYAPGAKGNVATEAVVARLAELGFATGVDPHQLATASSFAQSLRTAS